MGIERLCEWRRIAIRDREYPNKARILAENSSCYNCEGKDTKCNFYTDRLPVEYKKIPRLNVHKTNT